MAGLIRIFIFLLLPVFSFGQNTWYLNFTPGIDYVPPMPLVIKQTGFSDISFIANYETAPLKTPIYYSYRIGLMNKKIGWEMEMNHLKIYLKEKTTEIQRFSVSHGYNQLFVNRVIWKKKFGTKLGLGLVFAHPENTVRNLKLNENGGLFSEGYYITGPAIQYGLFRQINLSRGFYILIESKISMAYAVVPVVKGRAQVPVLAFHLQIGPGYSL